jgi:moderate conductance mechanosensitive channel
MAERDQILTWLAGAPIRIVVILLLAFIAQAMFTRLVRRAVATAARTPRLLRRGDEAALAGARAEQRSRAVGGLLTSSIVAAVWTVAVIVGLSEVGVNIAPLIASAGIVGVAVGFGAQALVKDYLAGIFIVIEDQYGIGDVVQLGEIVGTVEEVRLRVTRLRDESGVVWYVRNGELVRIANRSQGSPSA